MNVKRRSFIKIVGLTMVAATLLVLNCNHTPLTEKKPNILFILVDDLGQHQLGSYGSTYYETPNIDQLAKEGMKFTNAYAAAAVCSPTRASIMTGKYPARLHLTNYIKGNPHPEKKLKTPEWTKQLLLEEETIAESLKKAGYVTGHFGKWHLNVDKNYKLGRPGDPGSQGFDEVFTSHKPQNPPPSKYPEDWHHVREITEYSLDFIQKNKDKPFFCYVSHNTIHSIEIEKDSLIKKYIDKPGSGWWERNNPKRPGDTNNPKQAAMIETLDKSIGTILTKLKEWDLEKNTIVIFFSDNGHYGQKDGKPFRGSKSDLYEGGIRMPLIVRWPGVVEENSVNNEVVISNDFFPTFNDLAGYTSTVKNIDGVSLAPLFKDRNEKLDREAVYWHYPHYHFASIAPCGAMRMGQYKLIEWFEKSVYDEPGAFELYDLVEDANEQNDLAKIKPEIVEEMKQKFNKWRTEVGAQMMVKNQ